MDGGSTLQRSPARTMVQLLQERADQQADKTAYIFLTDGEKQEARLSYVDLEKRVRAVAAFLQHVTKKGERVLLFYPPGLEYIVAFLGCLYAAVVAVPAYPPPAGHAGMERSLQRIKTLANDAQARVVLTTETIRRATEELFARQPDVPQLRWLTTDAVPDTLASAWREAAVDGETLAFLQYTSGSTGTPKGVMLTHANLLHNHRSLQLAFDLTHEPHNHRFVSWLPLYHDMGLIGNMLQSLYMGAQAVLLSPASVLQRPLRWLQAISTYRATISGGPNFAYDLCVRRISVEQRATLDLRSWYAAFNGAEPVRWQTLERFAQAFEMCGLRREALAPTYGLAEATLFVAGERGNASIQRCSVDEVALEQNVVAIREENAAGTRVLVSCGHPGVEQQVVIADPESGQRCEAGQVGEVWVASPSVTRGYWGKVGETAASFQAFLAETGEGPFLRTGDMGFLYNGGLYITGRLKDLIIIRGRNLYPQDIESTVEACHEALTPGGGVAFSVEVNGEEQLIIVYEVKRQYRHGDKESIIEAVREAVAKNHEVQPAAVMLIQPATLSRTSSGKLQRRLMRAKYLAGELDVIGESCGKNSSGN